MINDKKQKKYIPVEIKFKKIVIYKLLYLYKTNYCEHLIFIEQI